MYILIRYLNAPSMVEVTFYPLRMEMEILIPKNKKKMCVYIFTLATKI